MDLAGFRIVHLVLVTNVNLNPDCLRPMNGPDNRQIYACEDGNLIDDRYTNIHRVGSTSDGYTYDVTLALEKPFGNNLRTSASYTYGDAEAVNDGTSSQINSIWTFPATVGGGNNLQQSRSDFSLGHRILARATWRQEFLENLPTSLTVTYVGESGRPFSYIIRNSEEMMGLEDAGDAELFFVPENASDLTFAPTDDLTPAQQAAELEEFIQGSGYLSERRGQFAERNGDRTPFENVIDVRLAQEFLFNVAGRQNRGEIYLNIFNFTNLLNDDWGRRYVGIFSHNVLNFEEFQDPDNGDFTPVYTYQRPDLDSKDDLFENLISDFGTFSSRWQMQIGVRYSF